MVKKCQIFTMTILGMNNLGRGNHLSSGGGPAAIAPVVSGRLSHTNNSHGSIPAVFK